MQAEFAKAVDPLLLAAHDLISRIERCEPVIVSDATATLRKLFEKAEASLKNGEEWQYAKYAICCWIDSQLIMMPWDGQRWWIENALERQYFNTGFAHAEYFIRAKKTDREGFHDALELFYLGVVLGFRGIYGVAAEADRVRELELPDTVEEWCRRVAASLHLRQGRPPIDDSLRAPGSARPLTGRTMLINLSMVAVLLVALASGFYILFSDSLFPDRGASPPANMSFTPAPASASARILGPSA